MYIHNSQPNISVMYLHHFVFCPFLLVFFLVLCPFFTRNDIHVKIYYKVLAIEPSRNICNLISTKLLKLINNILGLISNPSPFSGKKCILALFYRGGLGISMLGKSPCYNTGNCGRHEQRNYLEIIFLGLKNE